VGRLPANETAGFLVTAVDMYSVTNLTFTLTYDPALVTVDGAAPTPLTEDAVFNATINNTDGSVTIAITNETGIGITAEDPTAITNLTFRSALAIEGLSQTAFLSITNATAYAGNTSHPVICEYGAIDVEARTSVDTPTDDCDDNPTPYRTPTPTQTPVPTTIPPTPEQTATTIPGTPVPDPTELTGTTELPLGPDGAVETRIILRAEDMSGDLTIDAGVVARDASGNPIDTISIVTAPAETLPSPEECGAIDHPVPLYAYTCTPDGATFTPAITLTFTLTEEEWDLFGDNAEVGWFNSATGEWEMIAGVSDADQRTITIQVSHFSTYALFAEDLPEVPLPDVTSVPAGDSGSTSLWVWVALLIVVVGMGGVIRVWRKKEE